MSDIIEEAPTSRSRCRECRGEIEEGDMRFGSEQGGYYGDGDSYGYYHLKCASRRLPERVLAVLKKMRKSQVEDYDALITACSTNVKKSQSKYPYGERAPTGRARCIQCTQPIAKDAFRVAVEMEIVTGAFTRMGAAYLHPACAVTHLGDPNLGALLLGNSPMLSAKELKELAAECDAAAASSPGALTKKAKAEPSSAAPRADQGADLVFADALMERGDLRGELIMVEAELGSMSLTDPRYDALTRRAEELRPRATTAWRKELGKRPFALDHGLPALELALNAKTVLPDEPWLMALHVSGGRPYARDGNAVALKALAAVLQAPSFSRVRRLTVTGVPFDWAGLRGFCSCDEVKNLEALDISLALGPRALLMLLGSTRLERLTELVVSTNFATDPDARGFESAAGLPALRRLWLRSGIGNDITPRLVRSPLVQRLEVLRTHGGALKDAELPKLRHLVIGGFAQPEALEAIAKNRSLTALESIDLGAAFFEGDALRVFADPRNLPALKRLDISPRRDSPTGVVARDDARTMQATTLAALRKRFGDKLIAKNVEGTKAPAKPAKKSVKKAAKKRKR